MAYTQGNNTYCSPKDPKVIFLGRTSDQMKNYVSDLECNLAINKEIIEDLVKKRVWSLQEKRVVEKLIKENTILQNQVNNLRRERDDAQIKLLIAEQINDNYRRREIETMKSLEKTKQQFTNQLCRKDQSYKMLEKKYEQVLGILNALAKTDQKLAELISMTKIDCKANSKKAKPTNENSFQNEKDTMDRDELFNKPNRGRKYSVSLKTKLIIKGGENELSEREADRLREKILELYKHNLILSEELREAKGIADPKEESASDLFVEGNLKRWSSTSDQTLS